MTDYWLTFRIASETTTGTYSQRYDDLIDAVNASGTGFWSEPTSFIAIRSSLNIDALGAKLKAAIDDEVDLIVIRTIGVDNTRYAGPVEDSFFAFFPKAKKL